MMSPLVGEARMKCLAVLQTSQYAVFTSIVVAQLTCGVHRVTAASQDVGGSAAVKAVTKSVWTGVYTKDQAERGALVYARSCEACHQGDLLGFDYNPALVGPTFHSTWKNRTVGELLEKTQQTMPKTAPGSLSAQEYADVIGYVLRMNGLPAGESELSMSADHLKQFVIIER
jgi:mono/diheme cytochrome c family protein